MMPKKEAILFDLDGTLWDSTREVLLCWNKILSPLGRTVSEKQLTQLMGLTPREIGDRMFPDLRPTERYALTDRCLDAEPPYLYERGARLYPKVRETLRRLKQRYCIALVSNCTEPYARSFFHAHGLSALFDDHETAGRTGLNKGANISLVLARNHIDRAVYVGDTVKDLVASQEADIPFIFASWGFGDISSDQPSAETFSELTRIVSSVMGG